jgi:hypothetical protein
MRPCSATLIAVNASSSAHASICRLKCTHLAGAAAQVSGAEASLGSGTPIEGEATHMRSSTAMLSW